MTGDLFSKKFTSHLKQALISADSLAKFELEEKITIQAILTALKEQTGSIASEILRKAAKAPKKIPELAAQKTSQEKNAVPPPSFHKSNYELSVAAKEAIVRAVRVSQKYRHKYIGTEHLLKSILSSQNEDTAFWLKQEQINVGELEKNLHIVLESTSKFPDLTAVFRPENSDGERKQDQRQSALEYFGRELTDKKIQKDIDPVIGRAAEIERLIHILCRRNKNNPLLIGEAGVGKTAIVEGLAKKISLNEVPPILYNKKIYTIDLGAAVAGTIYRGEFEARFKNIIEVAEKEGNVILFIDEIHTIIGAGSASGSLDAANMIKPALARGRISVIGATTLDEYKKHIETDSALERRLQPILIEEPTEEETKEVLRGIRANYENFHNVNITDQAIDAAVKLSNRFIPEKLQPDKAIDLIDEAASRVKVKRSKRSIWERIRIVEMEIETEMELKSAAVSEERYQDAIEHKSHEISLQNIRASLVKEAKNEEGQRIDVTEEHIAQIVSILTKIPLGNIGGNEQAKLANMENDLRKKIIGQDAALDNIANLIRRARTNVADPKKPIASFMFLGPSGVGKTETAKQLAAIYFDDPKALIRIDMSELSESFGVSRLVGAPAGYVGYRDSNKFTDLVRQKPYSVVLLDEIEKAHPDVFNLLLQILEDGHISDSTGRKINFKNTIVIMTSNIGLEEFNRASKIGFEKSGEQTKEDFALVEKNVVKELHNKFRPEFLNRVDKILVFNPLSENNFAQIVQLYVDELNNRLSDRGLKIHLNESALKHIVKQGYNPETGARGVRKFFQDNIESEVAKLILQTQINDKSVFKISADRKSVV